MPTIPYKTFSEAEGLTKEVYEEIMRTYGTPEPDQIYQLMGHTPEFFAASWRRSSMLYGRDTKFTLKEKHIVTLAISATNNCEYCTRKHIVRMKELGITDEELIEVMMVMDLTNGYDKFVIGTQADTDNPTIPPLSERKAEASTKDIYGDIRESYGRREPDMVYQFMGYVPGYLKASWERSRLCFQEEGKLGLKMKHAIAFGVAATNSCDYYVGVHAARLKELGTTDEELVELMLIVDLTCGYNRYVQGLQADTEVKPFGPNAEANRATACFSSKAPSCCG
jgi:AhpD family alkylhydroperoxidase